MTDPSITKYFDTTAAVYGILAERNRWSVPNRLMDAIDPHINSAAFSRMLDVGIGTGLMSKIFKERQNQCEITGMDIAANMLRESEKTGQADFLVTADAINRPFPFKDNSFDLTVASGVSEFFLSPDHLYPEMIRVTRPGGIIAFSYMPTAQPEAHLLHDSGEVRIYCQPRDKIDALSSGLGIEMLDHTPAFAGVSLTPPQLYAVVVGRVPQPG